MTFKQLLILVLICSTGFSANAQYQRLNLIKTSSSYAYHEGKRVQYEVSREKIIIKFKEGISNEQKQQICNQYQIIEPLQKDMFLPSPKVCIAKLKNNVQEDDFKFSLNEMNQNTDIEYANPILQYSDGTLQAITDFFIVKLKQASDINFLQTFMLEKNLTIHEKYPYDVLTYILKVNANSDYNALQLANLFFETGKFAASEPDFLLMLKPFTPNDPLLNYQWGLQNTGSSIQFNGSPGADIKVFDAWNISTGDSNIKIAILDAGIDLIHPELADNLLPGFDGTLQGSYGGSANNDAHGTSCAGIIAAKGNNGIGISGIAYHSKIIPVRITYSVSGSWITTYSWLASCIDWAWNQGNADVLSNSWGGGAPSVLVSDAIARAVDSGRNGLGAAVIFSAGNNNGAVSYPATLQNVISVTATSMCDQRKSTSSCDGEGYWGSNYGSSTDVSAPGVKIYTLDNSGTSGFTNNDYFPLFNGTSSAAPHVAGVMALILSVNPTLSYSQARQILESTCDKVGSYSYNYGINNQPNGSWSNDLGYGRINAYAALQMANPTPCTNPPGVASTYASPNSICSTSVVTVSIAGITFSSGLSYQWQSSSDTINYTNIIGATSTSHTQNLSATTWFRCLVSCGSTTSSNPVLIQFINSNISTFPAYENFDSFSGLPCGWTLQDVNNDTYSWLNTSAGSLSNPNHVKYGFNFNSGANDYLFSPAILFTAGMTYRVKFWYKAESSSYPEKLELHWGNAANAAAMNAMSIFNNSNIVNTNYEQGISDVIIPTTSGNYYLGFKVYSDIGMWNLHLDDIEIEVTSTCLVPLIGGSITGNLNSPAGTNTNYTLAGNTGNAIQWELSSDSGSNWSPISNATSSVCTLNFLPGNYQLRARSFSPTTSCVDVYSNTLIIQINSVIGDGISNPLQINLPYSTSLITAPGSGYTSTYAGIEAQVSPDIFFRFTTSACADSMIINSCGSDFDTYLHILDSVGNHLVSNDDYGPYCATNRASLKLNVDANKTYYAVLEGYANESGNLMIDMQEIAHPIICHTLVNLTCFIEGYYQGNGLMNAAMFNQGIANSSITDVDDIVLELHESTFPYSLIAIDSARLQINGLAQFEFPLLFGNYYLVFKHRNAIATWSKFPIPFLNNPITYNFSLSDSMAYGNNLTQVDTALWAMYTGDIIQDENIDLLDLSELELKTAIFASGYEACDLNGDSNVDLLDEPLLSQNINNFIFSNKP